MAKKIVKEKAIEETLWQSCDKLRGSVEPAEYKHVVLGLIFLKFANDKFEQRRKELIEEGKEKYVEMKDFYTMKNVFYLGEISRWSYIIKNAKQNDISLKIDTALNTIEKNNPALKGALPDNYFSRLALDKTKLASLLDTINDIDTLKDNGQDVIGRVYEYLPEFLFLFLKRDEFDRYAAFNAWSSTRDTFDWPDMCNVKLPIPTIEKQEAIVTIYHALETRKRINEQLKESIKPLCPVLMKGVMKSFEVETLEN